MAESLIPNFVPGMVALKEKSTGEIKTFYPIDSVEVMKANPGKYEVVNNGSMEAARMSVAPLKSMVGATDTVAVEVVGIEGQVVQAATAEEAEKIAKEADNGGKEVLPEPEKKEAPKAEPAKTEATPAKK